MCNWEQEFVLDHDGVPINLCHVIGKIASPPLNLNDQPKSYPKNWHYMFPTKYNDLEAEEDIRALIKACGVNCFAQTRVYVGTVPDSKG